MNVNYNYLGGRREADSQKNRTIEGSRPQSTGTRTSWWLTCCFMMMLLLGNLSFASAPPVKNASAALTACGDQVVLSAASLPITNQALVCGTSNDITAADSTVCGSASYKGGLESLYSLTPTASGEYTISITGQTYTGIFVYSGCPTAGGACVGNATSGTNNKSLAVTLTAGTEYFIMFDTWPSPASPCPGTFSISLPPLCPTATAVTSSSITSNSASISWTGAGNYVVEYGPVGFTPGVGATAGTDGTVLTGSSLVALSGLTSATAYRVYVRQICPNGGYSPNSAVHSFTTACAPIATFPAIQTFETVAPVCWTRFNGGDLVAGPSSTTSTRWGGDGFLNVGFSGSARINIYTTASTHWLISNDYVLPASATSFNVSYDVGATDYAESTPVELWEDDDFVELLISNNGTNWVVLKTYSSTNIPSNLGQLDMASIGAYAGQTIRFAFRSIEGATNGAADFDFFVDNFRVGAAPGAPICAANLMPMDAATDIAKNTVLTWSPTADATSYDVYFGTSASPTFVMNVTGTSYSPNLLASNTMYYWSVRPKNDAGTASGCAIQSFMTGTSFNYCASVPTGNDNSGISNVQIASTDFPIDDVTYSDQTASPVTVTSGTNVNVQITFATGYTYDSHIWIDINNDGDFTDAGELVYTGVSGGANPFTLNASFLLDEAVAAGMHRMRIGTADSGQATPDPCYSGSYGVTADFMLNVVANAPCAGTPAPGNTLASASAVCSGESSTLTLQNATSGAGVTYVWQSADDMAFTINVVTETGTTASLEITPTTAKYYRAIVTCGGASGTSTAVMISINAAADCYCDSVPTSFDGDGITNVQIGTTDFPIADVTYSDQTVSPVALTPGAMNSVQITFATGYMYDSHIWIDFNDDGDFIDAGELVYSGVSTNANPTTLDASFMLDAAAAAGTHRMRIGTADSGQFTPDPCYSGSYGVTIDFTVTIGSDCTPTTWYADADGDGYGNAAMSVEACEAPEGYVADATDCDDTDASVWRTGNFFVDNDGDGYTVGEAMAMCYGLETPAGHVVTSLGVDCDDNNAAVYQSAMLFVDNDGDGYTVGEATSVCYGATIPEGYVMESLGIDCDDNDAELYQSILVFADNDGDGYTVGEAVAICFGTEIPEGFTQTSLGADCNDNDASVWQSMMLFVDNDGDGYTMGEATSVCFGATMPEGYVATSLGADCNDQDASVYQSMMLFVDNDGDGFTVGEAVDVCYGAEMPEGYVMESLGVDCDDDNAAINPNATEIPGNGIDENCNGMADDEEVATGITVTVKASQCGSILTKIYRSVFAASGPQNVTMYTFEVTDPNNMVQVITTPNYYFQLTTLPSYEYNTAYSIRVGLDINGVWQGYGAACTVSTPDTKIVIPQCGTTLAKSFSPIFITGPNYISSYEIRATSIMGTETITRTQPFFQLTMFPTIYNYNNPSATAYSIEVRVKTTGNYGPWTPACTVTAPGLPMANRTMAAADVNVVAYPNPFSETFGLDITRGTEGIVEVQVYDMIGKLLEVRSVQATDLSSLALGNRFPAGVYNVVVTHGEMVKTLRVIKR